MFCHPSQKVQSLYGRKVSKGQRESQPQGFFCLVHRGNFSNVFTLRLAGYYQALTGNDMRRLATIVFYSPLFRPHKQCPPSAHKNCRRSQPSKRLQTSDPLVKRSALPQAKRCDPWFRGLSAKSKPRSRSGSRCKSGSSESPGNGSRSAGTTAGPPCPRPLILRKVTNEHTNGTDRGARLDPCRVHHLPRKSGFTSGGCSPMCFDVRAYSR